jgi:hypothetical protein
MTPHARRMTSGVCLLHSRGLNQIVLNETRGAVSKIRFESQAPRRRAACRDPTRRARARIAGRRFGHFVFDFPFLRTGAPF